jgi:regulator of protease activity HflC (stomatin/prohibitin superfamily)
MILERVLNVLVILSWALFILFLLRFLIYSILTDGVWIALKKLFKLRTVYILLIIATSITILNSSVVFIQPQEVGVVVSLPSPNGYRTRPLRSGLHWIVPLAEEVHTYPISWRTYTMSAKPSEGAQKGDDSITARTSDGQEVIIDCTIIFQINPEEAPRIYIEWQDRYIEDLIRPLMRGLIRTLVSQYKVDEVNSSKRMDLEDDLSNQLRKILDTKGFVMDRFLLRNITFSKEYAASVERKQVAMQDAIEKKYKAEQIQKLAAGEAGKTIILAQAEATAVSVVGQALANNPGVITLRYVDKIAPGIQVMLVPNNAPYILPLPEMKTPVPASVPTLEPASSEGPGLSPTPTPIMTITVPAIVP